MESWDRPPPDIEVIAFFEQWLPEAFTKSGRRGPLEGPTVRASISGEGGGAWELFVREDVLSVGPVAREPPDVWVRQSAADLRAAVGTPDPAICPVCWSRRDGRRSICCSSTRATSR